MSTAKEIKHYTNYIIKNDIPHAISKEELVTATEEDQRLARCIEKGQMGNATDINQYKYIFPELTVVNGLIMKGERIVIPEKIRCVNTW